jgi:hypothetical protein
MGTRHTRGLCGMLALVAIGALSPASVLAAGPSASGVGVPGQGQPDNDSRLSVLTPEGAAFMQRKLQMAGSIPPAGMIERRVSKSATPMFQCEYDPCDDVGPWPKDGPPASQSLMTKARHQNNNYFCGPAAGQVVINWTRGVIDGNNDGENVATNWRKQSKVAEWMRTTTAGTGGANLAAGLNHPSAVLKPVPEWVYSYASLGSPEEFHNKVVTDIAGWEMPLILATAPHLSGAGQYYLQSWPNVAPGAHHWIVIRGYAGLWGSPAPSIRYQDSAGRYGGGTGAYEDLSAVVWQVSKWNQGGHIVW